MNKERKTRIGKIIRDIERICCELETVKNDEENVYDNIPENLTSTYQASCSEEAIEIMDESLDNLTGIADLLQDIC